MKVRYDGLGLRSLGVSSHIGNPTGTTYSYNSPRTERLTYSTSNPSKHGVFTEGSGFIVDKTIFSVNPGNCKKVDNGTFKRNYTGGFVPKDGFGGSSLGGYPSLSTPLLNLDYYGAKGFNRMRPNKALYDLGTFVGELRDFRGYTQSVMSRFRELRRGLRGLSRSAASNYLDYEFGLGATIRDALDILHKQQELNKRIRQLVRDNGKPVRRRGVVETVESSTSTTSTAKYGALSYPILPSQFYGSLESEMNQNVSLKIRYWFSGRFRYYIDGRLSGLTEKQLSDAALRRLTGTDFDHVGRYVTLVWELMPWSWLIDWASNVGDVLANASAAATDNLIADYAYIMGEYEHTTSTDVTVRMLHGATCYCNRTRVQISKQRSGASPYGFGLGDSWLTPRRSAILTAIGMTKYR